MAVNTEEAVVLKAGQTYKLARAIERMARVAIGRMTQRATIYRGDYVGGGPERLKETMEVIAEDVPCAVEGWRMPVEQTQDNAFTYQIADKRAYFPVGTDIRRDDVIVVDGFAYAVEGLHGPSGNLVELTVILRAAIGYGESLL